MPFSVNGSGISRQDLRDELASMAGAVTGQIDVENGA